MEIVRSMNVWYNGKKPFSMSESIDGADDDREQLEDRFSRLFNEVARYLPDLADFYDLVRFGTLARAASHLNELDRSDTQAASMLVPNIKSLQPVLLQEHPLVPDEVSVQTLKHLRDLAASLPSRRRELETSPHSMFRIKKPQVQVPLNDLAIFLAQQKPFLDAFCDLGWWETVQEYVPTYAKAIQDFADAYEEENLERNVSTLNRWIDRKCDAAYFLVNNKTNYKEHDRLALRSLVINDILARVVLT